MVWTMERKKNKKKLVFEICELHLMKIHKKKLVTLSTQVGHPNGFDNGKTKQKSPVFEICELHLMKNTKKVGDIVEAGGAAKWFGQCERTPAHIINNLSTGLLLSTRCTLYIDHIFIG